MKELLLQDVSPVIESEDVLQAFSEALYKNHTIARVALKYTKMKVSPLLKKKEKREILRLQIDFYCHLNKNGRGSFFSKDRTREEWVEKISEAHSDRDKYRLSRIFFFLLSNPGLCDGTS